MTAEMRIPTETVTAHLLSPAILTLDEQGRIGINCVDDDDIVRFYPVALSGNEVQGIWISGLPERVEIIVVGQEFVRAGDKVRPTRGSPGQPGNARRTVANQ